MRALAGSHLEATFETALFFAEGDCQKINVLAIQKENELIRSIGFGGHCATGVDFIATVIGIGSKRLWIPLRSPSWIDRKMWLMEQRSIDISP